MTNTSIERNNSSACTVPAGRRFSRHCTKASACSAERNGLPDVGDRLEYTSLPEVVGNGGIVLDPTREDDWIECILKIAQGGGDRDLMIHRGLERVRMFSWKKAVEQHVEVYRGLVS